MSITLDDEVLAFVDQLASDRSSFINNVLWQEKRRVFMKDLEEAYKEQANDPAFQEEVSVWGTVAGDGSDACQ